MKSQNDEHKIFSVGRPAKKMFKSNLWPYNVTIKKLRHTKEKIFYNVSPTPLKIPLFLPQVPSPALPCTRKHHKQCILRRLRCVISVQKIVFLIIICNLKIQISDVYVYLSIILKNK